MAAVSSLQADLDVQHDMQDLADPAGRPLIVGAIPGEPPGFRLRPDALAKLDNAGTGTPAVHVVIGMPGAGKTQLAAGYARARLAAGWRLVAWVNATDTRTLLAGLGALADATGLSAGGQDAGDLGPVVRRWLETDGDGCLLVFDNAQDRDLLRMFIPAGGAARVLVTGERQSLADLGALVPVGVFTAEEARAFLAEGTSLADHEEAANVASELGYLPLALAQAAAVTAGQRLSYGTYLERLRALPAGECLATEPGQPYPPGVPAAVLLSLDAARASDQSGVSAQLMEIIAVLSGAGVRRAPLHAAGQAGVLADGGQQVAPVLVDGALEHLARWSLLAFSLDGQTIIVHDLVTRVIRDRLARRQRLTAVGRAAALALEAQSRLLPGAQDRLAIRDIAEQVMALAENLGIAAGADEELMRVLLRLRLFALGQLMELGDSAAQAVAVGEPLTADLERLLGPDHSDTLSAWDNLAAAYRAAGRAAQAIPLLEQSLASRERTLGSDHRATLTSRSNLAAAYRDVGRVGEAIPLLEMVLAGRERRLAAEHPGTLAARNNLAAAYQAAGRAAEAIPLSEQNLAGCERILGPGHLRTLAARNNLANAYRDVGRTAEAIPLLEQNLAGCERILGPGHLRTLAAGSNLAAAYQAAGRAAEAIPLFEQNLAGCERILGPGHPRTLAARINLAAANQAAGRPG